MSRKLKKHFLQSIAPSDRRSFLKQLSIALTSSSIASSSSFGILASLAGEAQASELLSEPTFFLEIDLRDNWDFINMFVSPGMVAHADKTDVPIFHDLIATEYNHHLTSLAKDLKPYLSDIAVLEVGEHAIGTIHGHEPTSALRSPGRVRSSKTGFLPMWTNDPVSREKHYGVCPTPAVLHNYFSKQSGHSTGNAVCMRSWLRTNLSCYHFSADLANAQPTRYESESQFLDAFAPPPNTDTDDIRLLKKHQSLIYEMLKSVDGRYLGSLGATKKSGEHRDLLQSMIDANQPEQEIQIAMSEEEDKFWSEGVQSQQRCGDKALACTPADGGFNVGRMYGYAAKLFQSGKTNTAIIDFDHWDIHDDRVAFNMETMASQTAVPLARFISSMKTAGIWDRTVVAAYTYDGSRGTGIRSVGSNQPLKSKNSVMLMGGGIKGGYFGDVRYGSGGVSARGEFYRPNDQGITDYASQAQVSGSEVYKTVMTAAGIPKAYLDSLPGVSEAKIMEFMLKKKA